MAETRPEMPSTVDPQPPAPRQLQNQPSAAVPSTTLPDEYDRRGIKLPARTLVGGIITPI